MSKFSNKTKVNMRGSLWKNTKKETSNQPDLTGNAKIDGVDYFLAGWVNESKEGKRISISFNKIQEEGLKDDSELFF